ncbi:hypothetical protein G3O08_19195 [Cryomorpha ignava]|uniref:L,D-TPase catalytic domain-containing protein n=1 Tax=Cryomorpha ignava TaxID=101383 RepID=A0A7K3WV95_9FLAO|nr:hypothetical protein [Cryomorpha ignava]NEN25623.1 hypothetical protein [Cryomorpha ignava]
MIISESGFKTEQLNYSRVRDAYANNESAIKELLRRNSINEKSFSIYLRAFKQEKLIELWVKEFSVDSYKLLKTYSVCKKSGDVGPKRKQGDKQVPEGFYHIDRFNPKSKFHLSLGINYPNKSDRILGNENPGSDIFIHGACETIGCMPITDIKIEELYVFCVEARNNGQSTIPITIFPCKLADESFLDLKANYENERAHIGLWTDLKKAYDLFDQSKKLPRIDFLPNGRHRILAGK